MTLIHNLHYRYLYIISNSIINGLPLFYKEKINRSFKTKDIIQNEENTCPICDDNKVTVMIECCVKIF